jgi:hypothetical protein
MSIESRDRALSNALDAARILTGVILSDRPQLVDPMRAVVDGSMEDVEVAAALLSLAGNVAQAVDLGWVPPEELAEAFGVGSEEDRARLLRNCTAGLSYAAHRMMQASKEEEGDEQSDE